MLGADVAAKFLAAVLRHPKVTRFLSDEHFSVDGTLVEAWASLKSFRAKDGSDEPIEESFAWTKTIAGLHKTKHRGVGRVAFQFVFAMAAYNLIRMPRLLSTAA